MTDAPEIAVTFSSSELVLDAVCALALDRADDLDFSDADLAVRDFGSNKSRAEPPRTVPDDLRSPGNRTSRGRLATSSGFSVWAGGMSAPKPRPKPVRRWDL